MRLLLGLLISLLAGTAVANDTDLKPQLLTSVASGWQSEGFYLFFREGYKIDSCNSSTVVIKKGHGQYDELVSMALSAFHAKSKVIVRVSSCDAGQPNSFQVAVALRLVE